MKGSFDDPLHYDEICVPLRSDFMKARVTTANIAPAKVAMSTIGVAGDFKLEEVSIDCVPRSVPHF